jgi:NhaP-type Na+/H+ or K+/H+ antiporter
MKTCRGHCLNQVCIPELSCDACLRILISNNNEAVEPHLIKDCFCSRITMVISNFSHVLCGSDLSPQVDDNNGPCSRAKQRVARNVHHQLIFSILVVLHRSIYIFFPLKSTHLFLTQLSLNWCCTMYMLGIELKTLSSQRCSSCKHPQLFNLSVNT